jgi:transposase
MRGRPRRSSPAVHVEAISRRQGEHVYTYYYLRHTYREDGKVKHRTVANLSSLPLPVIELIRAGLQGKAVATNPQDVRCVRSRSYGAVFAVTAMMQKLGLPALLGAASQPWNRIALAMVAARILCAGSKLAATRWWESTTLAEDWQLPVDQGPAQHAAVNQLYDALDALLARQGAIQKKLAERHLSQGALVLFDLSSSYLEGRACPLAAFGHNRDGKRGKKQITYGLLTTADGCPVAIEVFRGNAADPITLQPQIQRLQQEYGFSDLVVVGDRGMISKARIADLQQAQFDWISALKALDIQRLHRQGVLQLSIFDETNLAEIHDPEQPERRLVACRNPLLAEERSRKRQELLADTEAALDKIKARVGSARLKTAGAIGVAVGRVIDKRNVAKHFHITIADGSFSYQRDQEAIDREAATDGIYVVATNLPAARMNAEAVVAGYMSLRNVEQAFRTMKTTLIELRPIFHRLEDRVRAHAFLCMLAYYVVWHMRRALQPLLTEAEGFRSLQAVLGRLSTIQRQTMEVRGHRFPVVTEPDPTQRRVFELLDLPTPVARAARA